MAAPQDTVQCCCGSLHTRCISGALGTREEYHPHKISRNIHHVCVDPCDLLSDSGLDLIRYESIFGDCGIEWHCVVPDHRHSLEHKGGFVQQIVQVLSSFRKTCWIVAGWSAQCQLHKVGNSERHSAER